MSAKQEISKGILAVAIIFILLFVAEVISVVFFFQGMPVYFWAIGITFLILGIIILIYAYRKPTISEGTGTPSITLDISDGKLFRGHLIVAIFLFIIVSMLFGLASAPFTTNNSRIIYIVTGVILLFAVILNLIIYAVKPKGMRQRYLESRAKKAAKKGN
jgi:hypothetical protein